MHITRRTVAVYCVTFFAVFAMCFLTQSTFAFGEEEAACDSTTYISKSYIAEGDFTLLYSGEKTRVQGGCYVEDGLYVFCCTIPNSDELVLRCFDSKSMDYVWEKTINGGYHGNAICFRPVDRRLYIADCFSYMSRDKLRNTISVVEFDNIEAGVVDVIKSPARGNIYSIAYDRDTDTFFSTNYRGNKERDANALFIYNGVFESVKDIVYLDDFAARFTPPHSSQGVQCVKDGIAYIPYYSPDAIIAGYDITNGQLLFAEKVPKSFQNHKIGELEAVMFDPDEEKLTVLSKTSLIQYGGVQSSAQRVFSAACRYIAQNYGMPKTVE